MDQPEEIGKYEWLPLLTENYTITLKGEPLLLSQQYRQSIFQITTTEGNRYVLRLCSPVRSYQKVR